ncbi:oligosaccharide flippase family protein [Photobacterium damselae]|uniref:oligosaccharide flippase family protein n=1 Tax=Photobacterium damselae TaxID=38293 RepID=UPI0035A98828
MNNIFRNSLFLFLIRIATLGFPIFIIPLLISRIGLSNYGITAYYTAFFSFFVIFINFGFDESATKKIAKNNFGKITKKQYVASVLSIKIVLSVLIFITVLLYYLLIEKNNYLLFFSLLIFVEAINCLWFFQGIEKIEYISISTTFSKIIYIFLIYIFVKEQDDTILVPIFLALAGVMSNVYPFIKLCKLSEIDKSSFNFKNIYFIFKDSLPIFWTNFIPSLKDKIGTLILGNITTMDIVAIYDIVIKFLNLLFIPINILNSAFFPELSKNREKDTLYKLFRLSICYSIIVILFVCLLSGIIFDYKFSKYVQYENIIKLISITVIFYSVSVIIAKNILIVIGEYGYVIKSLIIVTAIYLISSFSLVYFNEVSILNLTLLTVLCFFIEMLIRIYFCIKNKFLHLFN